MKRQINLVHKWTAIQRFPYHFWIYNRVNLNNIPYGENTKILFLKPLKKFSYKYFFMHLINLIVIYLFKNMGYRANFFLRKMDQRYKIASYIWNIARLKSFICTSNWNGIIKQFPKMKKYVHTKKNNFLNFLSTYLFMQQRWLQTDAWRSRW